MPGFVRVESMLKAKVSSGLLPWEQVQALAVADGWLACWDPGNPTTRTIDSGRVASIADGLGNLPAIAQATAGVRPILEEEEFGALDAMTMRGNHLVSADFGSPLSMPVTVLQVRRHDAPDSTSKIIMSHTAYGGAEFGMYVQHGASTAQGRAGLWAGGDVIAADNTSTGAIRVVAGIFDGASSAIWQNGASIASGNAGGHTNARCVVGIGPNLASNVWEGEVGVTLYRADADTTPIAAMSALLMELAGIS
jgi:hypothetical protein